MPDPPAASATLAGLSETTRPLGDDATVSVTVPLNPPRLARLIVEVALEPDEKLTVDGFAVIPKSGTLTVTVTL